MGQRVLDAEGPTMEMTVAFTGSFKGTAAKDTVTFVGRPTSAGVIHGEGRSVIMAGESEIASSTAEAFGRISPSGTIRWRGAHFFRTSSSGKLSFLNNSIGVFEAEIDTEGNTTEKIWEWKLWLPLFSFFVYSANLAEKPNIKFVEQTRTLTTTYKGITIVFFICIF